VNALPRYADDTPSMPSESFNDLDRTVQLSIATFSILRLLLI
jgi:hypothetical protein